MRTLAIVTPFFAVICLGLSIGEIPKTALQNAVQKLKSDPDLKHGLTGVLATQTWNDSVISSLNPDLGLVPASVLKTITTATALELLGSDFRYETTLGCTGKLDSVTGVLYGDLVITGSGDPSFGSKYFRSGKDSTDVLLQWVRALFQKGIREIKGAVIADARCFEHAMIPGTWIWADMGNYFGAGACGLNYHDNLFTVYFRSGESGTPTTIREVKPVVPGLKLLNKVTAGGAGDNAFIYGSEYDYHRYITGTIPAGKESFDIDGSLPDPAFFCAWSLDSLLRIQGIKTGKKPYSETDIKASLNTKHLFTHYSPELKEIIRVTNQFSVNLYAECLLKTIARNQGAVGTTGAGCARIAEFWQSKGISTAGMYQNDGSGLSRWNSVSARHLVSILAWMTKSKNFESFYRSLPESVESTRAKGGYITRVRGYAGYHKRADGKFIAFAFLLNNYTCPPKEARLKLESLIAALR